MNCLTLIYLRNYYYYCFFFFSSLESGQNPHANSGLMYGLNLVNDYIG